MVELLTRYQSQLPICVIHCFTGTKGSVLSVVEFEEAEVLQCTHTGWEQFIMSIELGGTGLIENKLK